MAVEFYDWVFLLGFFSSVGITGFTLWKLAHLTDDLFPEKILRAIFLCAGSGFGFILALAGYLSSPLTGVSMHLFPIYMAILPLNILYVVVCVVWKIKEKSSTLPRKMKLGL